MKLRPITAAHAFLEPLTWSGGRRARSVHADTASEIWTDVSSISSTLAGADSSSQRRERLTTLIVGPQSSAVDQPSTTVRPADWPRER